MIHVWRLPYKWLSNAKNFNSEIKFMGKFAGWHIPFLKFMMEIDICYFRIDLHPRNKIFSSDTCWVFCWHIVVFTICYWPFFYYNVCSKRVTFLNKSSLSAYIYMLCQSWFFFQCLHRGKWIFSESLVLHFLVLKHFIKSVECNASVGEYSAQTSQIAK